MHSNFITPPDVIEDILIVDATDEEIFAVGLACENADRPYNVYMYKKDMDNLEWLSMVAKRADVILQAEGSDVPTLVPTYFGPNSNFKTPSEYFNK